MFQILFFINSIYFVLTISKESIHIMEDLPIGTSIYRFTTNGCQTTTNTGIYRFVDSQKNSNDFFLIDPYTGRVTTKKLIDRDEFCLRRMCSCSKCEIILEVICVNMGDIFFNDLSIIIDDQNDHQPQFPKSSITIDILENVPIGYLIPIDIAIDLDYGNNSIQNYELSENNSTNKILNAFQIEYSKKNDLLALRLMKILDRELYHSLEYIIQAYDGGQPQALTGRLNIYINILDVNDMSPVFDRSDIQVLLSETTSVGSLVARVHAYDRDTGVNGLVYYSIVALDPPSNGTFMLSKETGEVRLGKRLDYEKEKSYRMKIKAQDNGPQQGSIATFAMIYIEIKDENDNYPLITSTFNDDLKSGVEHLVNTSIIKIRENISNGTFLGHISISDLDQGNNGRVSWSLESNGSISIKQLFNNEAFLMFTSRIFDREEQSQYEISLKVHDHGNPPLSNTLNFTLIILDENDNAPKFDQEVCSINITETVPIHSKLFHFNATDADEENTSNSQIEYYFNNQTTFSLNSTTGELYLIEKLDREEKTTYEFDIIAFDHGQPHSLSSTIHCHIHLIDVNDNYPIFDLSEYIFEIDETWSNLFPIGHVHATDADEYYGKLSYTLVHNETTMTDEWPFELTSNGTLYLKKTYGEQSIFNNIFQNISSSHLDIDYERRSIYKFLIFAFDNHGLNTSVPVIIYIKNRNDFCPELLNNSTALFFNTDLWLYNSSERFNEYDLELYDGDNDTCIIELLNFNDIFQIEFVEHNQYVLFAHTLPEREYYILQFRLRDLINETNDQPCIRHIQLVLTIGTNETNQTVAIDTAREYLEALHLISKRTHSYFDLTLINVIFIFILLSIAILIGLISIKLISRTKNSQHRRKLHHHRNDTNTLYRLQGPTDTQLPLLDNGPGEQSLTSSLIIPGNNRLTQDENNDDEQQQQLLYQLHSNSNEFKTFTLKSNNNNNTYDVLRPTVSPTSNFEQQRYRYSITSSNHSQDNQLINTPKSDSLLSSLNAISRTLTTFSYVPTTNNSGNELSTRARVRLAEQEIIEV